MKTLKELPLFAILFLSLKMTAFCQTSGTTAVSRVDTPEDMRQLLTSTGENYRQAKSFVIQREMVQTEESDLATMSAKYLLEVSVDGSRYRLERKDPLTWDIRQSDGKTQWIWYPWRGQYVEGPAEHSDPEGENPGEEAVTWLRQIDQKLASSKVQPGEAIRIGQRSANCMVIIGPPATHQWPDPSMREYTKYWIDRDRKVLVKEQYVLESIVPEHKFSSSRTTTYTVTELNPRLADSLFRFVPETGMERVEKIEFGEVKLVGKAAPLLRLKTLNGQDFDLSSLRGKPVLVDFWATWCVPCRESMPHLAKLYDDYREKGLMLVSVSKDDDPADAARFIAKYKYDWINVGDPNWKSDKNWGTSAIPRLLLIDKDGKVLFESNGYDESEDTKIRAALHKMDPIFPAVEQ